MDFDPSYNVQNYHAQGGANWVVGPEGRLDVHGALIVPSDDPHVAGAVWNNNGTLAISAG